MYKLFFLSSLMFVSFVVAQSPIVITNANMPVASDTLRYTNVTLSSLGDFEKTGENIHWDFTLVNSGTSGIREFKPAMKTSYFFFFGSNAYGENLLGFAPAGFPITDVYGFYKKQNVPETAFTMEGVGMTFSSLPIPSFFTDKDEIYRFPLTFPKRDSSTFRFQTITTSAVPVSYSKTGYRITNVDGWGVVSTPFGTSECIRLVTTQYAIDSIKTAFFPLGYPNNTRSYQWLTSDSKIPFLEVSGTYVNNVFTPSIARYRGVNQSNKVSLSENNLTSIKMYPNPMSELLYIEGNNRSYMVKIFAADGKLVRDQDVQSGDPLDISGLGKGLYLISVNTGTNTFLQKVIKN